MGALPPPGHTAPVLALQKMPPEVRLPAGQAVPTPPSQAPEQAAEVAPAAPPQTPTGQGEQYTAPAREKVPAGHCTGAPPLPSVYHPGW